ncbi:MAG: hypothetical protein ACKVS6_05910 [Planctomycetota bacterium]
MMPVGAWIQPGNGRWINELGYPANTSPQGVYFYELDLDVDLANFTSILLSLQYSADNSVFIDLIDPNGNVKSLGFTNAANSFATLFTATSATTIDFPVSGHYKLRAKVFNAGSTGTYTGLLIIGTLTADNICQ